MAQQTKLKKMMDKMVNNNIVIGVLFILLIIATLLLTKKEKLSYSSRYQHLVDSVRVVELGYIKRLQKLKESYSKDSVHASTLQYVVPAYTTTVTSIKTKHNEIRHSYNNLPTDSQLLFFSNWLSKEASTR